MVVSQFEFLFFESNFLNQAISKPKNTGMYRVINILTSFINVKSFGQFP